MHFLILLHVLIVAVIVITVAVILIFLESRQLFRGSRGSVRVQPAREGRMGLGLAKAAEDPRSEWEARGFGALGFKV